MTPKIFILDKTYAYSQEQIDSDIKDIENIFLYEVQNVFFPIESNPIRRNSYFAKNEIVRALWVSKVYFDGDADGHRIMLAAIILLNYMLFTEEETSIRKVVMEKKIEELRVILRDYISVFWAENHFGRGRTIADFNAFLAPFIKAFSQSIA